MDFSNTNLVLLGLIIALVLFVMGNEGFKKITYKKPCPPGHYRNSTGGCVKNPIKRK